MKLTIEEGLAFVEVTLHHEGRSVHLSRVMVDTGSAGSLFATDHMTAIGIELRGEDRMHRIYGVGGFEAVFMRRVDRIVVGDREASNFVVEIGGMKYGFEIDGILGMDFLLVAQAVVDLKRLELL